jgi:hypothetical protein
MDSVDDEGELLNTLSGELRHRADANAFLFCVAAPDYTRCIDLWVAYCALPMDYVIASTQDAGNSVDRAETASLSH